MNFLFVCPSPGTLGGVETLIVRTTRWLIEHGHRVSLLIEKGDHWAQLLPKQADRMVLGDRYRELYFYFHAKKLWKSFGWQQPDVIKGFDLGASWIASQLGHIVGGDCRVIAGLYASFLFKWYFAPETREPFHPSQMIRRNYLKAIPPSARFVCGIDQVEELEHMYGEECQLWPIPLDTSHFEPAERRPKWGKIVSVGRLAAMKEYNFYMVDVVKELRRRGHDVTWSIFGGGEYEAEVRKRIQTAGLEDVITMEGSIPYHKFWQCLSDAYVFVGMGTAILEAAWFRVPNVYALAYDREGVTYGPVHGIPKGSIGPGIAVPPSLRVIDELERILRLSPKEYDAEANLNYSHVQSHHIDASMNCFLDLVSKVTPINHRTMRYVANYPRWTLHQTVKRFYGESQLGHPPQVIYLNGERSAA